MEGVIRKMLIVNNHKINLVELVFTKGTSSRKILFSYGTPVAYTITVRTPMEKQTKLFTTFHFYSKTTSSHINWYKKYLGVEPSGNMTLTEFDALLDMFS